MKILCSSDPPTAKKIKSVQKALHTYSKKKTDWDAQTAPQKSTKQPPKVMGPSNPNPNPNNEADADGMLFDFLFVVLIFFNFLLWHGIRM